MSQNKNTTHYITRMKEADKIFFLKFLSALGKSDNNFDDNEKKFITDMSIMFGIPANKVENIFTKTSPKEIIKEAGKIKDRLVALNIIKEGCFLANTDKDLSEKEVDFINEVGLAMKIEPEKIEQISQWVIDYLIWKEKEKIIFEQN